LDLLLQRTFWVLAGWVVVGPLSFMSTLDKLKVTNRLAILCVLMVAALVVAYALDLIGFIHADLDACLGVELGEGREQCRGETHLAIMNMDTVKTLTVYIFAFTCHQNIFGPLGTVNGSFILFFCCG
jgi:amino acid permease